MAGSFRVGPRLIVGVATALGSPGSTATTSWSCATAPGWRSAAAIAIECSGS